MIFGTPGHSINMAKAATSMAIFFIDLSWMAKENSAIQFPGRFTGVLALS